MIDVLLKPIVARIWRWRIARHERRRDQWPAKFMQWKRENPERCMYCRYTRWAASHGVKMSLKKHDCIEGKGLPHPLPEAKLR